MSGPIRTEPVEGGRKTSRRRRNKKKGHGKKGGQPSPRSRSKATGDTHARKGHTRSKGERRERVKADERNNVFKVVIVVAVLMVSAGIGYLIYSNNHKDNDPGPATPIPPNSTQHTDTSTFIDENGLTWFTDYDKGLAEASRTSKKVVVDLYTEWCHWCKVMDEDTYSDPAVKVEMGKFVLIKIDGDKEPDLISSFSVTGYPTILFLGPDGSELDRIVGYADAQAFLAALKAVE